MNQNQRLTLDDTGITAAHKLSGGNPGALRVLIEANNHAGDIDPDAMMGGMGVWLALDSFGIYGSEIWMLYKDVCGEYLPRFLAILRAIQLGFVSESSVLRAIRRRGEGIDVDDLVLRVKERLPNFKIEPIKVITA